MGFNAKLFEIVVYPESYDMTTLLDVLENINIKDYAYIIHDKDDKKSHCHIAIRTTDTRNSSYVAKWFNVLENAICRVKGRWSDMLKYLTHANALQKFQYSSDEVVSNFDWKAAIVKGDDANRVDEITENIVNGKIREYNYFESITHSEYIKFKRSIDLAFQYRSDKIKGGKRDMECLFLTGDSGFGKTSYAKFICEERNLSYFVSSGSNDVLDGYQGQDVIILDDLRPSCMGLSDLLKMLDNNTASTVKSRYKNKVLECSLIIITSVLEIDTFFHNVFTEEKETIVQLKRRCKTYIRMYLDCMDIYLFDDCLRDYVEPIVAKNPMYHKFETKPLDDIEKMNRINNLLGTIEIEESKRDIKLVSEQCKF